MCPAIASLPLPNLKMSSFHATLMAHTKQLEPTFFHKYDYIYCPKCAKMKNLSMFVYIVL